MARLHYRNAHAALIVYDITSMVCVLLNRLSLAACALIASPACVQKSFQGATSWFKVVLWRSCPFTHRGALCAGRKCKRSLGTALLSPWWATS